MSNTDVEIDTTLLGSELAPIAPNIPNLPMVLGSQGVEVVDWQTFLPEESSLPNIAALIKHEVEILQGVDDVHSGTRADRIIRASGTIIDLVGSGTLATMQDVATMIDFVGDNNPQLGRVNQLFNDGLSVTEVTQVYDLREALDISIRAVVDLYRAYGERFDDDETADLFATAIDKVIASHRMDIRFRDVAASVLADMAADGVLISNVIDDLN